MAATREKTEKKAPVDVSKDAVYLRACGFAQDDKEQGIWVKMLAGGLFSAAVMRTESGKWRTALVPEQLGEDFAPCADWFRGSYDYDTVREAMHGMLLFDLSWVASDATDLISSISEQDLVGLAKRHAEGRKDA